MIQSNFPDLNRNILEIIVKNLMFYNASYVFLVHRGMFHSLFVINLITLNMELVNLCLCLQPMSTKGLLSDDNPGI